MISIAATETNQHCKVVVVSLSESGVTYHGDWASKQSYARQTLHHAYNATVRMMKTARLSMTYEIRYAQQEINQKNISSVQLHTMASCDQGQTPLCAHHCEQQAVGHMHRLQITSH